MFNGNSTLRYRPDAVQPLVDQVESLVKEKHSNQGFLNFIAIWRSKLMTIKLFKKYYNIFLSEQVNTSNGIDLKANYLEFMLSDKCKFYLYIVEKTIGL